MDTNTGNTETRDALLTVGEALTYTGRRNSRTLRRWVSAGLIEELRDARGWRFYRRSDLDRFRPKPVPTRPSSEGARP